MYGIDIYDADTICRMLHRTRNLRIILRLLVVPTERTGKEHALVVCRSLATGDIYGSIHRGHAWKVRTILCHPSPDAETVLVVHTHPMCDPDDRPVKACLISGSDRDTAYTHSVPVCAVAGYQQTRLWTVATHCITGRMTGRTECIKTSTITIASR